MSKLMITRAKVESLALELSPSAVRLKDSCSFFSRFVEISNPNSNSERDDAMPSSPARLRAIFARSGADRARLA